jgi:hypothetical protein
MTATKRLREYRAALTLSPSIASGISSVVTGKVMVNAEIGMLALSGEANRRDEG